MARKRKMRLFFLPFIMIVPLILWNVLNEQIISYIGQRGWDIGMVVFIVCMVAASILPFVGTLASVFGGGGYNYIWGGGKKAQAALAGGRSASATVVGIGEHSGGGTLTINNQPVLNLKLQIDDNYQKPYEVSFDVLMPRTAVPQFQPGAAFAVKVDPADPQRGVLDPEGASSFGASGKPVVGGEGWTELDRTLLKRDGKDGMAKLLGVDDTGKSEDFNPVVLMTYEVYLPGEEPYTFSKEVPMPTQLVKKIQTVIGKTFSTRVHPKDREKMHVNITF